MEIGSQLGSIKNQNTKTRNGRNLSTLTPFDQLKTTVSQFRPTIDLHEKNSKFGNKMVISPGITQSSFFSRNDNF